MTLRGVLAFALSFAACSNEFIVLEQRRTTDEPDAEVPRDAGIEAGPSFPDATVIADARAQDANAPQDAMTEPTGANIVSGFAQTCALVRGALYCWGADNFGQVGVAGDRSQLRPAKLASEEFTDVCAGEHHTCALRADGTTFCWGANAHGELGLGDSSSRETPTALNARRFVSLSCGGHTTCALAPRGELWCWGDNSEGKLGQSDPPMGEAGSLASSETPIPVLTNLRFAKVSVGQGHVCAISEQGRVYCWGRNNAGQLGIGGTLEQTRTPTQAVGDAQFRSIAAGQFHSCAVDTNGGLSCWGQAGSGLLGLQTNQSAVRVPTRLEGDGFESVSVNWLHSCALKTDRSLFCWGRGEEGQLGDGDSGQRDFPTAVEGPSRWRSVNAGQFHSCGFSDDGLYCWGANDTGQLGVGNNSRRYIPIKVSF